MVSANLCCIDYLNDLSSHYRTLSIYYVVTAVGATYGPQKGDTETACQSDTGGFITTGGGFSTYYERPSWQTNAIEAFFNLTSADGNTPSSGYNPQGRGYPDISLLGADYPVMINGNLYNLFGTSASTPVFAGFVSLLNALRLNSNASAGGVGWLNPTLYAAGGNVTFNDSVTQIFTDTVSGNNKCCAHYDPAQAVCCTAGFTTCTGWDPVTGWGSIVLPNFVRVFGLLFPTNGNDDVGGGSTSNNTLLFIWYIGSCVVFVVIVSLICIFCGGSIKSQTGPVGSGERSTGTELSSSSTGIVPPLY